MAYMNNYSFNLGDRTIVIGNFDRGQSPLYITVYQILVLVKRKRGLVGLILIQWGLMTT